LTYRTYFDGLLADALARLGELAESRQILDQALLLVEQTDERMVEAELYRLRGELALRQAGAEESAWIAAASDFERALAIAQRQEARSLELRAAISLARLRRQQGWRVDDAQRTLACICAGMSEGRQLADQLEARSLLAESA
jgi:predicted ATPase